MAEIVNGKLCIVLYIDGPPYGSACCPGPARQAAALMAIIARPNNRRGADVA
jgi:hypothetical protein